MQERFFAALRMTAKKKRRVKRKTHPCKTARVGHPKKQQRKTTAKDRRDPSLRSG
jgi:hypothetical protein